MKKAQEFACVYILIVLIISLIFSSSMIFPHGVWAQRDSDNDGVLDSKETEMAKKYVPHLHFASGEQFFPTTANYHMERSELWLKSDGTNQLIDSNPTVTSISHYTSGDYFLSNRLDSVEEIAEDYNQAREKIGDTVYARVTRDSLSGNLIVQYWFFYAFNLGSLNQHQGDWEMIQIIFDSTERPTYAVYSQHFSGERAIWNDVEKVDGTHPRVYVALGSHASYFKPYQGKLGLESDTVGSREEIPWEDLDILYLGEMGSGKHPATQDWLEYGGRWGNWAELADIARGAAGPSGPGHGENEEKWVHPASWGSDLFLVNQSWFMLSWVAYYFLYIFTTIIAVLAALKIWRIIRRKREGRLNLMTILRSKAGVGVVLGLAGSVIYLVALFLPWYLVRGTIQTMVGLQTLGEQDLILIDGVNGLRVNTLQSNQGFTQLFGLGIPLAIILLSSVVLNFLDLVGVDEPETLSRTFLISGVTSLIPVLLILVFITQLVALIPPFASAMGGGAVTPQVQEMAERIASSPFRGQYSSNLDTYGNLNIWWSLALGSYLFIAAAALKLAAGMILRKFGKGVIPEKSEEAEESAETDRPEEPLPPP